jgi:hypothetical protein
MVSFCDKIKQFFRDVSVKESCVSSCCNTVIEKEHHHKHKHKHKHKEKIENNEEKTIKL